MPHTPPPDPFRLDPPRAAPVCIGFSGGLDSTALLHLLAADARIRAQGLRAVHVHHGLSARADDWAAHCTLVCSALDVPLHVARVRVEPGGDGPEAAARRARHAAFGAALAQDEILALAHQADDQAETVLLRALRGSGPDGLAAMRAWRRCGAGWLWRPLLAIPRAAIERLARGRGWSWIDDPSNADDAFDRNYLRLHVMPVLRARWPQAPAALSRASMLCADASALLDAEDAAALAACRSPDPHALSRSRLLRHPPARRARVLRAWIASLGLPALPAQAVARIEDELLHARADASARTVWQGTVIDAWRDLLHAGPDRPALPADWQCAWDGTVTLALPAGGTWALDGARCLPMPCVARARRGGERVVLPGRRHSHALKHVLQDLGVPPWTRARLPLLLSADGELLAAGDLVYSAGFDAWLREHRARLRWRENDDRRD